MGYFKVIIGMGSVGALTAGSAVLISMSRALGWGAVGYGIAGEHNRLQTMLLAGSSSPDGAVLQDSSPCTAWWRWSARWCNSVCGSGG